MNTCLECQEIREFAPYSKCDACRDREDYYDDDMGYYWEDDRRAG